MSDKNVDKEIKDDAKSQDLLRKILYPFAFLVFISAFGKKEFCGYDGYEDYYLSKYGQVYKMKGKTYYEYIRLLHPGGLLVIIFTILLSPFFEESVFTSLSSFNYRMR